MFSPAEIAQLRRLRLAAPPNARGHYAGQHARAFAAAGGVEFHDHRAYQFGDSPAQVDWKVYARSDRLYVRRFEQRHAMNVHLVVDASASMAYGERGRSAAPCSKFAFAARLAAAIALVAQRQGDPVSLTLAHPEQPVSLGPATHEAHLRRLLDVLASATPRGGPALLDSLQARRARHGLLVIVSDLLDDPPALLRAIARARSGAMLLHVLHPHELNLPGQEPTRFIDSETARALFVHTPQVATLYRRRIGALVDSWRQAALRRGWRYVLAPTDRCPLRTLACFLERRGAGW